MQKQPENGGSSAPQHPGPRGSPGQSSYRSGEQGREDALLSPLLYAVMQKIKPEAKNCIKGEKTAR